MTDWGFFARDWLPPAVVRQSLKVKSGAAGL